MTLALKLAAQGGQAVAPNPMVGAVIVKNDKIIGKGYHKKFGASHAEVNAIRSAKHKSDLTGATLYVTLEPCRHHGKTPPCQDLIEDMGITRIVCGSRDPFQGAKCETSDAEIYVSHLKSHIIFLKGKIAEKCQDLNKFYFIWITKGRPYITVKIAISADGFVAGPDKQPVHFTSVAQDKITHQLRARHQAILIGSNTVLSDNPHLGARAIKGTDPIRIILDSKKRIPKSAKVFRNKNFLHITKRIPLKTLFSEFAEQGISSVLAEPGPTLYKLLKKHRLIDNLIVLKGKKKIGEGLPINI